jgi:uncharacterized protein
MQKIVVIITLLYCFNSFAQDSSKAKPKEWLGVLTLTEKFKTESNWTPRDQAIVGEHFQRLLTKKQEGVVILAGRMELALNDPEMKGLVIFYAKDEKEALQFMLDDPAVKSKIMETKVFPYGVAVSKCD